MAEKFVCWHGTKADFREFSLEHVGEQRTQYGSGFYFGDTEAQASRYLNEDGSGYLIKAEVTLQHPVYVDGLKNANLRDVMLDAGEVKQLLRRHPAIYNQPGAEEMNPLADNIPEFNLRSTWTERELDEMIDELAEEYFAEPSWLHVENFFGEKYIEAFHRGMRDIMLIDGLVIDWKEMDVPCGNRTVHQEAARHVIAWFPEQIHVLERFRVGTDGKKKGLRPVTIRGLGRCVFVSWEDSSILAQEWAENVFGPYAEAYLRRCDEYGDESVVLVLSGLKPEDTSAFAKLIEDSDDDDMSDFDCGEGSEIILSESKTLALAMSIFLENPIRTIMPCNEGLILMEYGLHD